MENLNSQLQSALASDNYNSMAKAAKQAGIFSGQAPKKDDLAVKIQDYLDANVSIEADTDTVEDTSAVDNTSLAGVDNTPQPTGKGGGFGEFFFWPTDNVYAPMLDGKPRADVQFAPEAWVMVSMALPEFTDLKPNVQKAALKAAEPTKYTYTVTVRFDGITFESTDPDLQATDLTLSTINSLLEDCGQDTMSDGRVRFNLIRGKVKKSSSSGGGSSEELYAAADKDGLKPLSIRLKNQLERMAEHHGLDLEDWAIHGYTSRQGLINSLIYYKKKGYLGAVSQASGALFFDPGAMYPGYELAHSLETPV